MCFDRSICFKLDETITLSKIIKVLSYAFFRGVLSVNFDNSPYFEHACMENL